MALPSLFTCYSSHIRNAPCFSFCLQLQYRLDSQGTFSLVRYYQMLVSNSDPLASMFTIDFIQRWWLTERHLYYLRFTFAPPQQQRLRACTQFLTSVKFLTVHQQSSNYQPFRQKGKHTASWRLRWSHPSDHSSWYDMGSRMSIVLLHTCAAWRNGSKTSSTVYQFDPVVQWPRTKLEDESEAKNESLSPIHHSTNCNQKYYDQSLPLDIMTTVDNSLGF